MYVHDPNWEGIPLKNSIPTKYALLTTVALVRAVLLLCSDRFYIYIWAFSVFLLERFDGWMLITAS